MVMEVVQLWSQHIRCLKLSLKNDQMHFRVGENVWVLLLKLHTQLPMLSLRSDRKSFQVEQTRRVQLQTPYSLAVACSLRHAHVYSSEVLSQVC